MHMGLFHPSNLTELQALSGQTSMKSSNLSATNTDLPVIPPRAAIQAMYTDCEEQKRKFWQKYVQGCWSKEQQGGEQPSLPGMRYAQSEASEGETSTPI